MSRYELAEAPLVLKRKGPRAAPGGRFPNINVSRSA